MLFIGGNKPITQQLVVSPQLVDAHPRFARKPRMEHTEPNLAHTLCSSSLTHLCTSGRLFRDGRESWRASTHGGRRRGCRCLVWAPQLRSQANIPAAVTRHPQNTHTDNGNLILTISQAGGPKFSTLTRLSSPPLAIFGFTINDGSRTDMMGHHN